MPPSCTCTASREPDGYNKAHLQEFGQVLCGEAEMKLGAEIGSFDGMLPSDLG